MRNKVALIVVFQIFATVLLAQTDWTFNHLTTDDGLSAGAISTIYRDSYGFVWIGTSRGLNKYDGYEVTTFKNEKDNPKSLSGNMITTIRQGPNGNLWVGTLRSGISIYNYHTNEFNRLNEEFGDQLSTGEIKSFHVTDNQKMLVSIRGQGLALIDLSIREIVLFEHDPEDDTSLSNNYIFSVVKASEKEYWVCSGFRKLDLINIETGVSVRYSYPPELETRKSSLKPMILDSKGIIWIGTSFDGVIRYDPKNNTSKNYTVDNSGLQGNSIFSILEGQNGDIMLSVNGYGINVLHPETEKVTYISNNPLEERSLSSNSVYSIYRDHFNIIWIGTYNAGVNMYSPYKQKFKSYRKIPLLENSLPANSINEILEGSDGTLWIGTDGGGLSRLDTLTGNFRHFNAENTKNSIESNVVVSLMEDTDGFIWIGMYNSGISRYEPKTGAFIQYKPDPNNPNSLTNHNVWDIIQDSESTIWIATLGGGLNRYNPVTDDFTNYYNTGKNKRYQLNDNFIKVLYEDSRNNLWLGTSVSGISLFNKNHETFTRYEPNDEDSTSLLGPEVSSIIEDSRGRLLIGTNNGISIMNPETKEISNPTWNDLLPNKYIKSIEEDEEGLLWISTNNGVSRFNPIDYTIYNFSTSDGLLTREFNPNSSLQASDGTLYFGSTKGINYFRPDDVVISPYQPKVILSDIKLFGKSIMQAKDGEKPLIGRTLLGLDEISFTHNQNVIEVSFASLDFVSPSSNMYRYKLEGFSDEWTYTKASKRSATFTNLDPDTYQLMIQGTNSDGVWSPHTRVLQLHIIPAWWQTWWFRTMAIVMIVLIFAYLVRQRERNAQNQRTLLNQKITEATSQIQNQNNNLLGEQLKLKEAVTETNQVVNQAIELGDFSARIESRNKEGEWLQLSQSINQLFDTIMIPFAEINDIINAMASNDLSVRYGKESKGDILRVTNNLNDALDKMAGLFQSMQKVTEYIDTASKEMEVSTREMSTGISEIASSTSEMSNGAQKQVISIGEASNTLQEVLSLSSNVETQAKSINATAEKGVALSEGGQKQINSLESSIKKMKNVSNKTTSSIQTLIQKSSEIRQILSSIQNIAEETNMLALNATIEAAKAGDAGRGFAVVADQIRKLADNSNNYTLDIERITNDIQSAINLVDDLITQMGQEIQDNATVSLHTFKSFSDIADSYTKALSKSEDIVNLSGDQFSKVKDIARTMENVVVIAEEAAAGSEQIASSSNELSSGMNNYQSKMQTVSSKIKEINSQMSKFKLPTH